MSFKYEGFIVETHCNPDKALSDSQQQIIPEQFLEFLKNDLFKKNNNENEIEIELEHIRVLISELDQNLIYLLSERMESSEKVAIIKKINNLLVFQPKRWKYLIEEYKILGHKLCLSEKFIENIFKEIHKESINIQNKIINN